MNETQLAGDLFNSVVRSEHSVLTSRKIEKVSSRVQVTWLDTEDSWTKEGISTSFGYILDLRKYAASLVLHEFDLLSFTSHRAPLRLLLCTRKGGPPSKTLQDPEVTSSSTREMAIRIWAKAGQRGDIATQLLVCNLQECNYPPSCSTGIFGQSRQSKDWHVLNLVSPFRKRKKKTNKLLRLSGRRMDCRCLNWGRSRWPVKNAVRTTPPLANRSAAGNLVSNRSERKCRHQLSNTVRCYASAIHR